MARNRTKSRIAKSSSSVKKSNRHSNSNSHKQQIDGKKSITTAVVKRKRVAVGSPNEAYSDTHKVVEIPLETDEDMESHISSIDHVDSDDESDFIEEQEEKKRTKKKSKTMNQRHLEDSKVRVPKKNSSRKTRSVAQTSKCARNQSVAKVKVSLSPPLRNNLSHEEENTFHLDRDWRVASALDY